jgi:phosphatidylglycerophosphate synthase
MPAPVSALSTDHYLYEYAARPLSRRLCGVVHPNVVTLVGLLLIVPIAYGLLSAGVGVGGFVGLMLARYLLDCLDGEVARNCDQQSAAGALLDVLSDTLLFVVLGVVLLVKLTHTMHVADAASLPRALVFVIALLVAAVHVRHSLRELAGERSTVRRYFDSHYERVMHDNGLLFIVVYSVAIKLLMAETL